MNRPLVLAASVVLVVIGAVCIGVDWSQRSTTVGSHRATVARTTDPAWADIREKFLSVNAREDDYRLTWCGAGVLAVGAAGVVIRLSNRPAVAA